MYQQFSNYKLVQQTTRVQVCTHLFNIATANYSQLRIHWMQSPQSRGYMGWVQTAGGLAIFVSRLVHGPGVHSWLYERAVFLGLHTEVAYKWV